MKTKTLYLSLLLLFLASSCSNTKYLPKGDLLYTGAKVKVEVDSISKKERKNLRKVMQDMLRPKPNSKVLGAAF